MKLDVTVQRQSNIIIGMIVVVIASFFVAFAMAVGGLCIQSLNGSQRPIVGLGSNDIPEPNTGNEHLVPVAKRYNISGFDTVPGEIKLTDYNFPYIAEDGTLLPLPLCITNQMAQTWWFEITVTGGYTPEDTTGYWPWMGITIWQDKNKDGVPEQIQGWNLEYEWMNPEASCCEPKVFIGKPAWCGNVVCLDSNQYPVLSGGLERWFEEYIPNQQEEIPGKEVHIIIGLLFSGCPLDDQQFAYILAQKRYNFPNEHSPTPE